MKWLLTPIQFDPIQYFDSSIHTIDYQAKTYLFKADSDVQDMIPVKTLSDGNCLYHSIVCLTRNKTVTASELRSKTCFINMYDKYFFCTHSTNSTRAFSK